MAESVAELKTSVVEYHPLSSPSSPEMKRFLLTNPKNKIWVEAQEKRHKAEQNVKECLPLGHQYVSALSAGTRQNNRKATGKSDITYLLQTTKTVGSGRIVEYAQQEEFLISTVMMK
ncbi:hypothetical protein AXG93_1962s1520 [Marchantia polymorpha subsp. ruderalis]|uniref:Uncharacterized protein n=1 Tax=Marchantia polymorpha subsp. ruderalis TaxID=1480154 RepID=A0A176WG71_MARPO|nr:hypothetical protein AXG93_1962s1520 [Marchantia polymorpha subsp. ruderalis]